MLEQCTGQSDQIQHEIRLELWSNCTVPLLDNHIPWWQYLLWTLLRGKQVVCCWQNYFANTYFEHFYMANKLFAVRKVISRDDDTSARFAPNITEAIVCQICHSRPSGDVYAAVRSDPSVRTQTNTCRYEIFFTAQIILVHSVKKQQQAAIIIC